MRRAFSARRFHRGRLAARVCAVYLAVVLASILYVAWDLSRPQDYVGASFVAIYPIFLTAPTSMVLVPPLALLTQSAPPGLSLTLGLVAIVTSALLQAAGLWFALRGRTLEAPPVPDPAPSAPGAA